MNQFCRDALHFYELMVFQVTPNGSTYVIRLYMLFVEWKMSPPTPKEFSWFYTLKANKGDQGFYYFAKRAANGLQVATKIRESLDN